MIVACGQPSGRKVASVASRLSFKIDKTSLVNIAAFEACPDSDDGSPPLNP
jgi:hypothetical protein